MRSALRTTLSESAPTISSYSSVRVLSLCFVLSSSFSAPSSVVFEFHVLFSSAGCSGRPPPASDGFGGGNASEEMGVVWWFR
ncbi:hypothetical protein A2U01_0077989, partial [Trifolium medium]|nr:hypothetical protein [Trifolium medium]